MKKKIIILVDQLYKQGGIERLVMLKANYWQEKANYDVTIVSTENKRKKTIYPLNKQVQLVDLPINYNRNISYFTIYNLYKFLKNLYVIQKYLLLEKPDFVIVASHIPITYALPFLIRRKSKIIKEIHFTRYFENKNNTLIKKKLNSFVYNKYDYIIALSEEEKSFYNTENVQVIPNPIPEKLNFDIVPIQKRPNVATVITRIAPVKRLEILLKIWEKLVLKKYNYQLHIYGNYDSVYGKKLIESVKKKSLEEYVFFKGETKDSYSVLNKSKVSLLTSSEECFPMIILESFAMGVPVIAFDCPTGPRNIITTNKDSFLVDNNNTSTFVEVLLSYFQDNNLQEKMSFEAFKTAKKYNIDYIFSLWNKKIFNK